jgi:8-oxo-dGTP pyrophosphatase MutT (NUDIX family)
LTSPDRLKELLSTPEAAAAMDPIGPTPLGTTPAGVLVPLFLDRGELHAVFTRRRADMRRHAGEISFPGGRQEEDESLVETALREAEEEIGLAPDDVELVGALPPVSTFATGYVVYPQVGVIKRGHEWVAQPSEVAAVLELSLPTLRDGHEMKRLVRRGVPFRTVTYTADGHFVWGATARILQALLERLESVLD